MHQAVQHGEGVELFEHLAFIARRVKQTGGGAESPVDGHGGSVHALHHMALLDVAAAQRLQDDLDFHIVTHQARFDGVACGGLVVQQDPKHHALRHVTAVAGVQPDPQCPWRAGVYGERRFGARWAGVARSIAEGVADAVQALGQGRAGRERPHTIGTNHCFAQHQRPIEQGDLRSGFGTAA